MRARLPGLRSFASEMRKTRDFESDAMQCKFFVVFKQILEQMQRWEKAALCSSLGQFQIFFVEQAYGGIEKNWMSRA
jgi:hypothetical protein